MIKFIKNIASFSLFAFIAYLGLICIWGSFVPTIYTNNINYKIGAYGHLNSRIKEVKTKKNVDILFLGSSHVYRGLDPRVFQEHGYNVFNFGSSSQTPKQTEVFLKRYLKTLNPKLILYDVYPETFSNDGVESSLDVISNSTNDLASLNMAFHVNHVKTYNTLILGFFKDNLDLNSDFSEDKIKDNDKSQQKAFESVLKLIDDNDIPLKFIQIPVTKARYKSYAYTNDFDNYIKAHGQYYNFNLTLNLSDSIHFYDTQHLNSKGVKIFDNYLIETILKQ